MPAAGPLLADLSVRFGLLDWSIVVGYLIFTTWLGTKLAGKQATIRDFFLGGRKLPWYAVSGSIIATEISAATFVIVPFVVFRPGGNLTYLQLGVIGTLLARIIVGYVLVPAYYRREIYSPYDYMHHQLGSSVRGMTTALFVLGGVLAQSARVYLTAQVLIVILSGPLAQLSGVTGLSPLALSIILIGIVATIWTLIGGIATVIWTDVMLFLLFFVGALVALGVTAYEVPGGIAEVFRAGWNAKDAGPWGKFTFFDFTASWPEILTRPYTFWAACIAATWGSLHPYGTDQLIVQRMFCCKNARQARWAMISSTASQIVTFVVMLVGIGLYAYYKHFPLSGEALRLYQEKGDRIFPIFIVQVVPPVLKGLIVAGIMAAAISSLTSILAALSQTVMSAFYLPLRARLRAAADRVGHRGSTLQGPQQAPPLRREDGGEPPSVGPGGPTPPAGIGEAGVGGRTASSGTGGLVPPSGRARRDEGPDRSDERHNVFVGRLLVLFWGVVLCGMAWLSDVIAEKYPSLLDLCLAMAGYAGGALLAGFFLGFLPLGITGFGYLFAAPLSVMYIFALVWHAPWTHAVCWVLGAGLLLAWVVALLRRGCGRPAVLPHWAQTLVLAAGVGGMLWLNYFGYFDTGPPDKFGNPTFVTVSWPWYIPIGSVVAFVLGYLLSERTRGVWAGDSR